jgi:hypothetical protein
VASYTYLGAFKNSAALTGCHLGGKNMSLSEIVLIMQNNEIVISLDSYHSIKDAIKLTRDAKIIGRFEVHNLVKTHKGEHTLYSIHFIDEEDKIIGGVFPDGYGG